MKAGTFEDEMTNRVKIEALHRRLVDERRRNLEDAAETEAVPPAGRLACLADLDTTIVAVEAMLNERKGVESTPA